MELDKIAREYADDWWTIAPKHRTGERLTQHLTELAERVRREARKEDFYEADALVDEIICAAICPSDENVRLVVKLREQLQGRARAAEGEKKNG